MSRSRRPTASGKKRSGGRQTPPRRRWTWSQLVAAGLVLALVLGLGVSGIAALLAGSGSEVTPATVTGQSLPALPESGRDPALGRRAPTISGTNYEGVEISAPGEGPTVLLVVAHWCPECRREITVKREWIRSGGLPEGVDLITISSLADPNGANHPPDRWLERERWPSPVIADTEGTAARALGVRDVPMWVFLDDQGLVVQRFSGEIPVTQLESAIDEITD